MRIEPGVGWGEAKLGSTLRELTRAFGRPSKTETDGDATVVSWESQGLRVSISDETDEAEAVTLFGGDPDEPAFGRAKLDGSDVAFGMIEAALFDVLGKPTETFRAMDKSWVRHEFAGLSVRLVDGAVVSFTIEPDESEGELVDIVPRNPELEAAIIANPDERGPWLVFGDWLTQQGDPRGALIAEHASKSRLDLHAEKVLLGALAPFEDMVTDREWHLGFLRKAKVASNFDRSPLHSGARDQIELSRVLQLLLDGFAGRFLRELIVGISDYESNDYGAEMAAIGAKPRPSLRSLYVGDFEREETELNWSHLGNAGVMWAALPNLEDVTLRSGSMELGELVLPSLRKFATRTGGLSKDNVASLTRAQWPKLEHLDLQIGSDGYGSNVTVDDLKALIAQLPPTLRHLGLTNTELSDALVPVIASSPILRQLKTLDLSLGTLGAEGAEVLIAQHERFAHLEKIDLDESWLSDELIDRVREKLPRAVASSLRDDSGTPEDRYIAAGE